MSHPAVLPHSRHQAASRLGCETASAELSFSDLALAEEALDWQENSHRRSGGRLDTLLMGTCGLLSAAMISGLTLLAHHVFAK